MSSGVNIVPSPDSVPEGRPLVSILNTNVLCKVSTEVGIEITTAVSELELLFIHNALHSNQHYILKLLLSIASNSYTIA